MLQESAQGWQEEHEIRQEEHGQGGLDPLKTYLSEISKHPVLTLEEERTIAERAGRFKDGDAVDRLINSNLRLVVKIALEYYNSRHDILDLIQEGNEGLVRAARKYNPYKGAKFSTYSSFWIRAYILKHIMDSWSMVKIGTTQNQRRLFYRLKREKRRLENAGIFPAAQLVADILGVRTEEVEDMEKRLSFSDVSLDSPLSYDGEDTVIDTIRIDNNIEEAVADREKREILDSKIAEFREILNEKELHIFDRRIITDEPATLQDIACRFAISRERVRQLECRVLKKFSDRFETEFRALDF